jgi:nucleoside-diphosphate-sugar epimerase
MILITGASGLIGRYLTAHIRAAGIPVRTFDIAQSPREDTRNREALAAALQGVQGVVHLAAVSRVVWAEQRPQLCQAVNVDALETLLRLCLERRSPPWLIFASSREVYGQAAQFPVPEDATLNPMNIYARSKVAGERLIASAADAGLCAVICRLSNVYGCVHDHPDRVVMAFAGSAARGGVMRVEGPQHAFDFTAIEDVELGLWRLVQATQSGERMPPIHFVTGAATTLLELAQLATRHATTPTVIEQAPARDFDVAQFVGNPERAARLLGWRATIPVSVGVPRLIKALENERVNRPAPSGPEIGNLSVSCSLYN